MTVVGVMSAVRDAPSVVRDHNGGMDDVTDEIVQSLVVTEALVTAIVANNEKSPEHGALSKPVERPHKRVVKGEGSEGKGSDNGNILDEIRERPGGILLKALRRDGITKVLESKGRQIGQLATTLQIRTDTERIMS
jgi:hypothetical protein